jgi:LPS sulfotransferase NodH
LVRRTYLLASTPWAGSWQLGELLARGGEMVRPTAWFEPLQVPTFAHRFGLARGAPDWAARYLQAVAAHATRDGSCSLLLMWTHLRWMVQIGRDALGPPDGGPHPMDPQVIEAFFPQPVYLWVRCADVENQALRWYAARSNHVLGRRRPTAGPEPPPDFQEVRWLEAILRRHDHAWQTFFSIHQIDPTEIDYDDVRTERLAVLDHLRPALRLPPGGAAGPAEPTDPALPHRWLDEYRDARPRLHRAVGRRSA